LIKNICGFQKLEIQIKIEFLKENPNFDQKFWKKWWNTLNWNPLLVYKLSDANWTSKLPPTTSIISNDPECCAEFKIVFRMPRYSHGENFEF